MPTAIHRQVAACHAGTNPRAICRLKSAWLVLGDPQIVRGYCLLLPDPVVPHLNALSLEARQCFFGEMAAVGDVLLALTDAARINYEMLGNLEPALHAHLFPRYHDEPEGERSRPIWLLDWDKAPAFDAAQEAPLMAAIRAGVKGRLPD